MQYNFRYDKTAIHARYNLIYIQLNWYLFKLYQTIIKLPSFQNSKSYAVDIISENLALNKKLTYDMLS